MDASKRQLNLLDLTCIGINAIVGSSIFLFPGALAKELGPASVLAFAVVGVMLLAVGLCFAEASTHFESAGGAYLYADAAFGPTVGFGIGWMCWATYILGWAAVANGIAKYLGYFHPAAGTYGFGKAVAAVAIVALAALNYRGVKLGARASNFFTAAKLGALTLFILAGLPQIELARFAPFAPLGYKGLGPACFMAYFAFQGFEAVPVPGGETENPRRNVPLAVCIALIVASVVYMLVQITAVGTYPGLAQSQRPLADAAVGVLGAWGAGFIAIAAATSMTGYTSGAALVAPRFAAALAEHKNLPAAFAEPHPVYGTPYKSIVVTAAITLAAALALDFRQLVDISNIVVCVMYASTCVAVPILRRKLPAPEGAFKLPGGWLIPIFGLFATFWLGAQGSMKEIVWSVVILAAGFALRLGLAPARQA